MKKTRGSVRRRRGRGKRGRGKRGRGREERKQSNKKKKKKQRIDIEDDCWIQTNLAGDDTRSN